MSPIGSTGQEQSDSYKYETIRSHYDNFGLPIAHITIDDEFFSTTGSRLPVGDIHIELSAGYEASVASFRLYNAFDPETGEFRYDAVSSKIAMGRSISISLGYIFKVRTVFVGFICGIAFGHESENLPYIQVQAMDVKGLMMGGTYSSQLKAKTYGAAIKEIFQRTGEGNLEQIGGIKKLSISKTPDETSESSNKDGPSADTIEMVSESDYEFIVKVAKRFNYDFFVDRGNVIFRPAKEDTTPLITLSSKAGLSQFHIEYSISGVVGSIEARAMDASKGEIIKANSVFNNKLANVQKAKALVGDGAKVYVDSTITSTEQAQMRVNSLMERMSYRLGSIEGCGIGIPEIVPGRFIVVEGFGTPVDNDFYLTTVIHDFSTDNGYSTRIIGCAANIKE